MADIDTVEVREAAPVMGGCNETDTYALCDAVDQLRAERDHLKTWHRLAARWAIDPTASEARAEAAEARITQLAYNHQEAIARARAAEARIAELEKSLGACTGCNVNDGPDEYCPRHGRSIEDWIGRSDRFLRELHTAEGRIAAARRLIGFSQPNADIDAIDRALTGDTP